MTYREISGEVVNRLLAQELNIQNKSTMVVLPGHNENELEYEALIRILVVDYLAKIPNN